MTSADIHKIKTQIMYIVVNENLTVKQASDLLWELHTDVRKLIYAQCEKQEAKNLVQALKEDLKTKKED